MTYGVAPKPGAAEYSEEVTPYQSSLRIQSVKGGVPIAAVYAGYKTTYNFKSAEESRRLAFLESATHYKYFDASTAFHNPFVPPRRGPKGGIDAQRRKTAMADVFTEPLEVFKVQRFKSTKVLDASRLTYKSDGPSRYQKKGLAAYRKENTQNVDGM